MAKMQDESLENAARQVEEANRKAEEARTGRAEEEIKPIKEKLLAEFEEKLKAQEAQFAQAGRAKFQEAFGQQQKAVRERMEDEARWAAQLFDDAGMQYDKLRQDFARMQEEQNARMQQWQTACHGHRLTNLPPSPSTAQPKWYWRPADTPANSKTPCALRAERRSRLSPHWNGAVCVTP